MTRFGFVRAALMRQPSWRAGLTITVAALGAASLLRWALGSVAQPVPFITFYPAVLICALVAGWRWGTLCALAAALEVNLLFQPPALSLSLDRPSLLISLLFMAFSLLTVAVAETLRRTFRQVREANARTELLNAELRHRARNLLAIVQAIASQTASGDPAEFKRKFTGRLIALGQAQDLVAGTLDGACRLDAVVAKSCQAFHLERNFAMAGPPCVVGEDNCVPLTLALHELCTNATKYGALSTPTGRVSIRWAFDGPDTVRLDWTETGGPEVAEPKRTGFGTKLLRSQSGVRMVEYEFAPGGLRCSLKIEGARRVEAKDVPAASPSRAAPA